MILTIIFKAMLAMLLFVEFVGIATLFVISAVFSIGFVLAIALMLVCFVAFIISIIYTVILFLIKYILKLIKYIACFFNKIYVIMKNKIIKYWKGI